MAIGYACKTRGVHGTDQHAMRLASLQDQERFLGVSRANLRSLSRILEYNASRGIRLFRVSSDLIPLASHRENRHEWASLLAPELSALRVRSDALGMRLSMHPGQYTVLDSLRPDTVSSAVAEIEYSAKLLSLLSGGETLIVLHSGGRPERFAKGFSLLSERAQSCLVLENDETHASPEETLFLARQLGVPMVYDNLHAEILASRRGAVVFPANMHKEAIAAAAATWGSRKRPQKIHFSLQRTFTDSASGMEARPGAHSASIPPGILSDRLHAWGISPEAVDIMLETKDKNLSAVACTHVLLGARRQDIEREWGAWKYTIMEHSRAVYDEIRKHLSSQGSKLDREAILRFYELVAQARQVTPDPGSTQNALQHVWGYFKKIATEEEQAAALGSIRRFSEGRLSRKAVVSRLANLAEAYDVNYLLDSYFFDEP